MSLVHKAAKIFAPDEFAHRVTEITLEDLESRGIKGLILDLDNTLSEWQSEVIPEDILAWLDEMRTGGVSLCLASNTHNRRRLHRVAENLKMDYVQGIPKPRRSCFRKAMEHLNLPANQVAIVGDQLFTDILGGKRSGICSIMVSPIHPREYIGTKVSRIVEGLLLGWFERNGLLPHPKNRDRKPE